MTLVLALLLAALIGCAHSAQVVANPDVPNTFERCRPMCDAAGKGPPKVSVETEDSFRCFCTEKPKAI